MADGWLSRPFDLKGKRVFVAGHNGLVGSAVVRRLQSENCEILAVPRVELDLRDQSGVREFFSSNRPDVVICAAARVGGIAANKANPAEFFSDNILIQTNVIESAHASNVQKLVFLGSSCIYPKDASNPIKEEALISGALESSNQSYALAKIAGIHMCQSYRRQYGSDFISVMLCNLYGAEDQFDLENSHVVPALMMKAHAAAMDGGDFIVWGSGKPRREFLYVDDAADAIVFALKRYSSERPLNIGAGEDITIAELAAMIADIAGIQGKIVFDPTRPDGVMRKLMDSSRVYTAGWKPKTPLRSGLEGTYEWYGQFIEGQKAA